MDRIPMVFPPINFPVYVLANDTSDTAWASGPNGALGRQAWSFCVEYQWTAEVQWIKVNTFSSEFFLDQLDEVDDPMGEIGFRAAFWTINHSFPGDGLERPPGYLRSIAPFAEAEGRNYKNWEHATLTIDGHLTTASLWRFAGAWTMVCQSPTTQHYLAVIGVNNAPEGWRLVQHSDPTLYGYDLAKPIDLSSAPEWPPVATFPTPATWHPDHQARFPLT